MSLLSPILPSDQEGVKWAKLQRLLRAIADAAGISYTMSGFLSDINPSDTEGVKWAKLGAWTQLIADNISTAIGAGVTQIVAGNGISLNPVGGTGAVTVTASSQSNYASAANNAGNTTITPDKTNYGVGLTVGGAARTSIIILDTVGRSAGDTIKLIVTLPATLAIILQVRNATVGGTQLLPSEIFAANQFTTNGVDLSATWEFVYTGSAWKYALSNIPA